MDCVLNNTLFDLLCCPACHQNLELTAFDGNRTVSSGPPYKSGSGVDAGILKCGCGAAYPIIDGVPRLLEGGPVAFPEFSEGHALATEREPTFEGPVPSTPARKQNDFNYIRRAYSKEWGVFDYDVDKTWGWTLNERKKVFLGDIGLTESELKGKLLLDAGCGNGTLTAALSAFGLQLVGIDLNDRLGDANLHKARQAGEHADNVHFVQGNVFNPPFKSGCFDLIYCSGVLHRTRSSKETFKKLVPLLKRGGRFYVWVSGNRSLPVRVFFASGQQLKRFISLESLMKVCRIVAPFYKAGTELLNALGIARFRKRTVREVTSDLFDAWAPPYDHLHTEKEVQGWFQEMGFTNITVSGRQKHGFGCYGDRL